MDTTARFFIAIPIGVFVLLFGLIIHQLVTAAPRPTPTERAWAARKWAQTIGISVSGISCVGSLCTIGTEQHTIVLAYCGRETCSPVECQK